MTVDMWLVLAILVTAIVLFVTEWLRVDVVALCVVAALMLTGILDTGEALSGFSNSAVATIFMLFIVGGAVLQTGLAGLMGRQILSIAGTSERRLTVVLMVAVAFLSSFMSDTGTVAVLLPAVIILARSARVAPARLLIPLAVGSLVGGASTLIGTPPNIIVSDLLAEAGETPFNFFSYTPMGIVLVIAGTLYMLLIGRKLLPDRESHIDTQAVKTPQELVDLYRLPDNLFRLRVRRGSKLVGHTLEAAQLGQRYNVSVLEIRRREEPRPAVQIARLQPRPGAKPRRASLIPGPDSVIELDDVLMVKGDVDDVSQAAATWDLGVQPARQEDEEQTLLNEEVGVAEVVLPPRSELIGKTVVEARFGSTYSLSVLGVVTSAAPDQVQDVKTTRLRFGDILLVQGPWQNILALKHYRRDFIIIGQPEESIGAPNRDKAIIALLILLGMLVLMITDAVPLVLASSLAALAMVLTGCLTMDDAYQAVDWKSIMLVAGMIPMSVALTKVGLVDVIANGLVDGLGGYGPLAILVGLFLLTSVFTQFISNTATTVIIGPIALAAAGNLGVTPQAFLMAVALAASTAFATPVASPVNTLVMGAGNYRFADYMKVGVPLIFIAAVLTAVLLPRLFPF
jgi:di/tricarboxylate transporter